MSLPGELVDEILCHLPVKPLLQCRCVSKEWCSLIDSNAFIKKNLKKNLECNTGGGLTINAGSDKFYLADFDSLDDPSASVVQINDPIKTLLVDSQFMGTSNGLMCVFKNEMNDVFLFNPTTRKSRKIANSPPQFPNSFTPIESYMCGFGYDEVNDDYKVVKIADLKTNAWTWIQNVPEVCFTSNRGIFAGGSLHWTAISSPTNCKDLIVGFDLELQQFKEVHFPPIKPPLVRVKINIRCLFDVGGCLCITDNYPPHLDVWVMKIYGAKKTWYKALSVKQHKTLGSFTTFSPLAFSKSRSYILLEVDRKKLVWYDLDKNKVRKVRMRGIPVKCNSFLYTESLLKLTIDTPLHNKPVQQKPSNDKQDKNQTKRRSQVCLLHFAFTVELSKELWN
ncbi:F-box protein CPR1-like [Apium graveolens]|uniref:F-box protein CPR1-like n=1 Tax=Apium graveolens TaxID=4045 RepID=UPI003D7A3350